MRERANVLQGSEGRATGKTGAGERTGKEEGRREAVENGLKNANKIFYRAGR